MAHLLKMQVGLFVQEEINAFEGKMATNTLMEKQAKQLIQLK